MSACPNSNWRLRRSAPRASMWLSKERRRTWGGAPAGAGPAATCEHVACEGMTQHVGADPGRVDAGIQRHLLEHQGKALAGDRPAGVLAGKEVSARPAALG